MGDTARLATVSVTGRSSPVRSARSTAQETVTATEPPGVKSVVSTETARCAQVMCWELSAEAAVCCALDVAACGLRAIDAARAACAATPSTSMRAPASRPRATTKSNRRMSSGVKMTSSTVAEPRSLSRRRRPRSHGPWPLVVKRSDGPVATERTGRLKNGRIASACPVTTTVVVATPRVALTFGCTSTPEPSWSEHALCLGGGGLVGAALDPADGETLLGDGLGDVGGVLPQGELHDPQDQEQQQGRGDHELGGRRAALVSPTAYGTHHRSLAQLPGPVEMLWAVEMTLAAMIPTAVIAIATRRAMTTTASVEYPASGSARSHLEAAAELGDQVTDDAELQRTRHCFSSCLLVSA